MEESEIILLGKLLIAAHNSNEWDKRAVINPDSTPLEKHSFCRAKSESLKYESEQCRLLSALYESTANRPAAAKFVDELVDLISK